MCWKEIIREENQTLVDEGGDAQEIEGVKASRACRATGRRSVQASEVSLSLTVGELSQQLQSLTCSSAIVVVVVVVVVAEVAVEVVVEVAVVDGIVVSLLPSVANCDK